MTGAPDELSAGERQRIAAATHPAYRPDIDGLRAIAVLPVVLYHAGVRGFSGGFVGVDIFFVISGYLITGILARDLAVGRHSISEFYRRRILRIFPALMAMMLITTICACALLLPIEVADYARSLWATALFASNIVFYQATDYFDAGPNSQPLLHTWSLAVEEQWYILWPLVLAAIGATRPRVMAGVAVVVTLASLAFSIWLLPHDSAAAFYLLPPRAWELGLGATIALAGVRPPSGWLKELLAALGLAAILACVKIYTHDTNFPGWAAVPPCLGAALLIWTGGSGSWVGRLLSIAPLRFFGWISYSLYLWHWPVIVYADSGLFLAKTPLTALGIVIVSVALATVSWRYVERPFRSGVSGWPTWRVLGGGAGAILLTILIALGLPAVVAATSRLTPDQTHIAAALKYDGDGAYRRGTCFAVGPRSHYDAAHCLAPSGAKPALLVVGDSHAAQLWPGLARHRDRFDILQATVTGCVAKIFPKPWHGYCEQVIDGALVDWLATHRPAALILASRWQWRWLDGLEATLNDPRVRAAHPILIGPIPQYETALPRLLVASQRRGDPGLLVRSEQEEPFAVDRAMRAMAARTHTPYVSLIDLLCRGRVCTTMVAPGVPLQFDEGHLTAAGSAFVVDRLLPHIDAAMRAPVRPVPGPPGR